MGYETVKSDPQVGSQSQTIGSPCGPGYPRSISARRPNTTARAALSSSRSISNSPKVRVSGAPELADPLGAVEVGEHEDVEQFGGAVHHLP